MDEQSIIMDSIKPEIRYFLLLNIYIDQKHNTGETGAIDPCLLILVNPQLSDASIIK